MTDHVTNNTTSSDNSSASTNLIENIQLELNTETTHNTSCVCRDFLRNVCRRGDRCRFLHPADPTSARRDVIATAHHRPLVFCHDFQNATGCKRGTSCRFAHCTRDEEATYRRNGVLPIQVHRKLALDVAISKALLRGETPVCLDFIKAGGCRRANGKCRYRHVTATEFEREQFATNEQHRAAESTAATLVYRKRKLTTNECNFDEVVFCNSKLGCSGNVSDAMTSQTCTFGQLFAVFEPVNNTTNRWTTATSFQDYRPPFCLSAPCRLVAVPTAAAVRLDSTSVQPPMHFTQSPTGLTIITPSTTSGPLGLLKVVQPYV